MERVASPGRLAPGILRCGAWLVEFIRCSPKLDWNAVGLIATIELGRDQHGNPPVAEELSAAYDAAIRSLPAVLGTHADQNWHEYAIGAATACIALARGQRWFARAYFELDRDTAGRWFSEEFGWDLPDSESDDEGGSRV